MGAGRGLASPYEVPYTCVMTKTTDTHPTSARNECQIDRFAQPEYRAHLRQLCEGWTQGNLFSEGDEILARVAAPTLVASLACIEDLLDDLHVESAHSMKLAKLCWRLEQERAQSRQVSETSPKDAENDHFSVFQAHERQRDETIRAVKKEVEMLRELFPDVFEPVVTSVSHLGEWGVGLTVQGRTCDGCSGLLVQLDPQMPITIKDCWTCECSDAAESLARCFEFARLFVADLRSNSVRKSNDA